MEDNVVKINYPFVETCLIVTAELLNPDPRRRQSEYVW